MINSLVCVPSPFLDIHPESLTQKALSQKPTPNPSQGRGEEVSPPAPPRRGRGVICFQIAYFAMQALRHSTPLSLGEGPGVRLCISL